MIEFDREQDGRDREKVGVSRFSPHLKVFYQESTAEGEKTDASLTLWTDGDIASVITKAVSKNGQMITEENPDILFDQIQEAEGSYRAFKRKLGVAIQLNCFEIYALLKKGEKLGEVAEYITYNGQALIPMSAFLEQPFRSMQMIKISRSGSQYLLEDIIQKSIW